LPWPEYFIYFVLNVIRQEGISAGDLCVLLMITEEELQFENLQVKLFKMF